MVLIGLAGGEPISDLVLLGLLGIIDPSRQEVRDAVGACSAAGIRTLMIAGDHPRTAEAIVASVEEGRVIYDNLRRFVRFAVAGNIGNIGNIEKMAVMVSWPVLFLATTGDLGTAAALVPLQLLWLHLMTDGVLGLSMGLEPAEKGVMSRAPHSPSAGIWPDGLGVQAAWVGAVSLGVGFAYERAAVAPGMADQPAGSGLGGGGGGPAGAGPPQPAAQCPVARAAGRDRPRGVRRTRSPH